MKKIVAILLVAVVVCLPQLQAQLQESFNISTNWRGNGPAAAEDLGATTGNIDGGVLIWRGIQKYPNSKMQWALIDSVVKAVQAYGIDLRFRIRCVSPISVNDTIAGTCAYAWDHDTVNSDKSSWFPQDTTLWKKFIDSLIDRYDGNGTRDMDSLRYPVTKWHIEQEWARVWCSQYPDTSLEFVQEFVRYETMTYNEIKRVQPTATVTFAGIDTRHDKEVFYDGYTDEPAYCQRRDSECAVDTHVTRTALALSQVFLSNYRNTLYLLNNAQYDEMDIHQYGRWQFIPDVVRWIHDKTTIGARPIIFLEGGGPFCKACENVYHTPSDPPGYMDPELVRDNPSYVVYYYVVGIANGVKRLSWNTGPEYTNWGATWGDLDLLDINRQKKPSYYTYRFLSHLLSSSDADSIMRVTSPNDLSLNHYRISPFGTEILWSTMPSDTFTLRGAGTVRRSRIPTVMGDSVVITDTVDVVDSLKVSLADGVPLILDGITPVSMTSGWNTVSLPVSMHDTRTTTLFPTATSSAFSYTPLGYQQQDTMRVGMGYWIKFDSALTMSLFGFHQATDTITVKKSWNLIGTITQPVDVNTIVKLPSNNVSTSYYGYSTGYYAAATLFPGKAYWVKVNQDGELVLSYSGATTKPMLRR